MNDRVVIDATARILLQQAESEEVGLWQVVSELREHHGIKDANARRRLTLKVVEKLLENGVEVIDYLHGRGWERWQNQTPKAVLDRVEHEWGVLNREPTLGDICWFSKRKR